MNAPHLPKVAGIDPPVPAPTLSSASGTTSGTSDSLAITGTSGPTDPSGASSPSTPTALSGGQAPHLLVQDRLARWVSDLTSLQELTERLSRTTDLEAALHELLHAGATLVGAGRGLVTLHPVDDSGRALTVTLGLGPADLGHLETIPHGTAPSAPSRPYVGLLEDLPPVGARSGTARPDIPAEEDLDPRHRAVASRLGYAASYAVPLDTAAPAGAAAGRIGAAVWLYDEPAEPDERRRHLACLYAAHAAEHLARLLELGRAREALATLREELLPTRLPHVPGVRLAVRHRTGPCGGGDWYDALPLPEGALGLAVGGITGSGPGALAATGRLRASLRAYAVMEGEDPVAVLSDLELLLRLTEPTRSATALFAYCEPAARKVVLAAAGHCSPLIIGDRRTEYVDTSLSAPLNMLTCWEAPSVEIEPAPGETLLLYSDGLLHRTGDAMDRAFARLHAAAAGVPREARRDPEAVADHVLRAVLPDDGDGTKVPDPSGDGAGEDVVLLVAHFE
ncbi:PP2C family protein-serine/threonine phosphatase [Streptomyces luteireticuli]|uniref:PP2C family protein-serine/threonine phosphatase n=1 Tax=Streptomyces luteireticuli TaxID=173858 RepID=A0ABP3I0F0_9ACTN